MGKLGRLGLERDTLGASAPRTPTAVTAIATSTWKASNFLRRTARTADEFVGPATRVGRIFEQSTSA
jgi:hypothetical protein